MKYCLLGNLTFTLLPKKFKALIHCDLSPKFRGADTYLEALSQHAIGLDPKITHRQFGEGGIFKTGINLPGELDGA